MDWKELAADIWENVGLAAFLIRQIIWERSFRTNKKK